MPRLIEINIITLAQKVNVEQTGCKGRFPGRFNIGVEQSQKLPEKCIIVKHITIEIEN
jgi:hypothetical protein